MKVLAMDGEETLSQATLHIDGKEYSSTKRQPMARELGIAVIEEEKGPQNRIG